MKKLIILLTITISSISPSTAQSDVKIDIEDLQTDVSRESATLSAELSNIHLDLGDISTNLANIDDISDIIDIDLNELESLSNFYNPDLANITRSNPYPGIDIMISDSNSANNYTYAYTNNTPAKSEKNSTYSYIATESPQNNDIFKQLSNTKGIEVVYISKAMLGMMPNMNMPGVDIGNIAGKLESLEIYSAEEGTASKRLIYVSDGLLKEGDYETLMLIKDSDSKTAFYVKKNKSNQGSEMLMVTEDGSDATIIRFLGSFTIQDIKNIATQGKSVHINTNVNTSTSNRLSETELNKRIKEAQKRNDQAQKIAIDAQRRAEEAQRRAEERAEERAKYGQQRAEEAQKRAEERAKRAEERAKRAEERAKEAEERARKVN